MANLNLVPSITPEALAEIAAAGVDLKAINRANVIKKLMEGAAASPVTEGWFEMGHIEALTAEGENVLTGAILANAHAFANKSRIAAK